MPYGKGTYGKKRGRPRKTKPIKRKKQMAVSSTITYCEQADLHEVYPSINAFDFYHNNK